MVDQADCQRRGVRGSLPLVLPAAAVNRVPFGPISIPVSIRDLFEALKRDNPGCAGWRMFPTVVELNTSRDEKGRRETALNRFLRLSSARVAGVNWQDDTFTCL